MSEEKNLFLNRIDGRTNLTKLKEITDYFARPTNTRRYCRRINGKGYDFVPNKKKWFDIVDYEDKTFYALADDKGFEDIADRIFEERGYTESLQKIKNETGCNISKEEFLILAGYIFVDEGELFVRRDQAREKTIRYSYSALSNATKVSCFKSIEFITQLKENWEYMQQKPMKYGIIKIIDENYEFTEVNGKNELSKEELLALVEQVKSEIERIESIKDSKEAQENHGDER